MEKRKGRRRRKEGGEKEEGERQGLRTGRIMGRGMISR